MTNYNDNWHKYNKQHNKTGIEKTLSHIYKYNKDEIPRTIRLTIRVWVVFWFMNFLNRSLMIINYIDSSRMGHTLWNFHVWNSMGWKHKIKLKGEVINITTGKHIKQAKKYAYSIYNYNCMNSLSIKI